MNRRKFVRNLSFGTGAIVLSAPSFSQSLFTKKTQKITILHTNDTHSNIDPFLEIWNDYPEMDQYWSGYRWCEGSLFSESF